MKIHNNSSIIESIIPYIESSQGSYQVYASERNQLHLTVKNKKIVYFLVEGKVNVHRKVDNVLIFVMSAPAVLGLFAMGANDAYHYFETASEAKLIAIEDKLLMETVELNMLWKNIFLIASEYATNFFIRDEKFNSKNVYSIIRNHLEMIWEYPEEERMEISIFKFILSRSQISRSSLNKVLKDLIEGDYIKINRGRLLSMKELPSRY